MESVFWNYNRWSVCDWNKYYLLKEMDPIVNAAKTQENSNNRPLNHQSKKFYLAFKNLT